MNWVNWIACPMTSNGRRDRGHSPKARYVRLHLSSRRRRGNVRAGPLAPEILKGAVRAVEELTASTIRIQSALAYLVVACGNTCQLREGMV